MKCPKCGYNSFEYHDSCKKCSNDLTLYKATYGLKTIAFPLEVRTSLAEALVTEKGEVDQTPVVAETAVDMFSFDLPEDEAPAPSDFAAAADPFHFGDEPATAQPQDFGDFSFDEEQKSAQARAEEDAFASLLESASRDVETSDAASSPQTTPAGDAFEFDMESFSWDDTPAAAAETGTKPDDAFDKVFGDAEDAIKK